MNVHELREELRRLILCPLSSGQSVAIVCLLILLHVFTGGSLNFHL